MSLSPTTDRIESLDVLRGFALLGILLLNILGFGLLSASYSNPGFDVQPGTADYFAWATVELFAEGAMRCLFSILFGAGVVLFATGSSARGAGLHYRRTFWLLVFGLIDTYILLWNGDILINYAICGAILYWARNWSVRRLLTVSAILLVLMSAQHGLMRIALGMAHDAYIELQASVDPEGEREQLRELADSWTEFAADFQASADEQGSELGARTSSYASAFVWNVKKSNEMITFVLPMFLFWDALAMMMLGMALYKSGVLQGQRSRAFYLRLTVAGFAVGLGVNGYEIWQATLNNFAIVSSFAQMQATYHIGRLGMAMGWLGLVILFCQRQGPSLLRVALSQVGRMALTNYLMQSFICLILFTGAGFALLGQIDRAELYLVVLAIWLIQLCYSYYWMDRFRFGPMEWLWRWLTYGKRPEMVRSMSL